MSKNGVRGRNNIIDRRMQRIASKKASAEGEESSRTQQIGKKKTFGVFLRRLTNIREDARRSLAERLTKGSIQNTNRATLLMIAFDDWFVSEVKNVVENGRYRQSIHENRLHLITKNRKKALILSIARNASEESKAPLQQEVAKVEAELDDLKKKVKAEIDRNHELPKIHL